MLTGIAEKAGMISIYINGETQRASKCSCIYMQVIFDNANSNSILGQ